MASALIVEVLDSARNHRQEYVFARSPIRLGRSPLNDLPIERGFVSHCHGLFHFDASRIEFVDVGSTNGTFMAGRRLGKNQRTEVAQGTPIEIGTLRLSARIEERKAGDSRASYAFRALEAPAIAAPARAAYVPSPGAPSPSGAQKQAPAEGIDALPRAALLNERFARSFIELRRGQNQLLRDLGLSLPSKDKLQTLDSAHELLVYLLDPEAPIDRLDELSRAYADLMMHEVALLSAIGAGSRELLEEVSPQALAPRGLGGLFAWMGRLFGHDARWRALEKKFEELQEETARSAVVLGRTFARAYVAALGGPSSGRASSPSSDTKRP